MDGIDIANLAVAVVTLGVTVLIAWWVHAYEKKENQRRHAEDHLRELRGCKEMQTLYDYSSKCQAANVPYTTVFADDKYPGNISSADTRNADVALKRLAEIWQAVMEDSLAGRLGANDLREWDSLLRLGAEYLSLAEPLECANSCYVDARSSLSKLPLVMGGCCLPSG